MRPDRPGEDEIELLPENAQVEVVIVREPRLSPLHEPRFQELVQTRLDPILVGLDGKERKFIEESGVMNVMFVIKGVAITPNLSGTILQGITRDSVLTLLREMKIPCEERAITVDEVFAAYAAGTLQEAFGIGTAAVIAPIAAIGYRDTEAQIATGADDAVAKKLHTKLVAIQTGKESDTHNWLVTV
jgi:branched-chain amino acid aminotransferase